VNTGAPVVLDVTPEGVVTVTYTLPALSAGETATSDVGLPKVTAVAVREPNITVAPSTKPVPVRLTFVPPAAGPVLGLTAVTVGALV
jgi:hypothetical protein